MATKAAVELRQSLHDQRAVAFPDKAETRALLQRLVRERRERVGGAGEAG